MQFLKWVIPSWSISYLDSTHGAKNFRHISMEYETLEREEEISLRLICIL